MSGDLYNPQSAKPAPWQVVGTRGYMPLNSEGSASYSRYESALVFNIGPQAVSGLRFVYANRMMSSFGEAHGPNDFAIQCAMWTNPGSGSWNDSVWFSGVLSPTLQAGGPFLMSDIIETYCIPGQSIKVQSGAITSPNGAIAASKVAGSGWPQSFGCESTAASSQVYNFGGSMTIPGGGVASTLTFAPLMVLGQPAKAHVAVAIMGASQAQGTGDTPDSTTGFSGWAERMLIGAAGNGISHPFTNLSRSGIGTKAGVFLGTYTWWSVVPYVSHVVIELGFNDISTLTLAQIQANLQTIWARVRSKGKKVWQSLLLPKTTSTDSWATLVNQTIVTGYESSGYPLGTYPNYDAPAGSTGTRGALNAWLVAQVAAGNLDGVLDGNAVVEAGSSPGKWAVTGVANAPTSDGQHPSATNHAAIAAALNTVVSAWTV